MILGLAGSILTADLRGLTRFITKTNSTKFSDAEIDGLLNLGYHEFINEIIKAGGKLDFNIEEEQINLTNGTKLYTITGKVLQIKTIDVNYGDNQWQRAAPFNQVESSKAISDNNRVVEQFVKTDPFVDIFVINEVYKFNLYPILETGAANVTNGLLVTKVLEITELSATSDEPKVAEAYQKWLVYFAARMRFLRKGLNKKAADMQLEMDKIMIKAETHYQNVADELPYSLNSGYGLEDGA